MEKTKNFFDDWADTQKKMYENWTNQAHEFQKNILDGKAFSKGSEVFQDLLKKQQDGFKNLTRTASKLTDAVTSSEINPFENFVDQWKNIQDKTMDLWTDNTKKFQDLFSNLTHEISPNGHAKSPFETSYKFQDTWLNALKSMSTAMKSPFDHKTAEFAEKTLKDTFNSMQKGTDSFMKLYELWAPVFKAAQNNITNTDEYKRLMNPVLYKELIDGLFNFNTLTPLKQSYDQFLKTVSSWYENLGETTKENYEAFKASLNDFSKTIPKNQEFLSDMFKSISGQMKTSVSPFFKLIPESKEKEQMALINELAEYYTNSANKLASLQYLVYLQGIRINDSILDDLAEKTKKGELYQNFSDFYTHWVNVNGKSFEEFFRTDEFSKLQGDLVTLDAQIRSTSDKLMEYWLSPYPVVLKSQLDELYKTNYDLKKQVYQLSKQLTTLAKEKIAKPAKAPVTPKTAENKTSKIVAQQPPAPKVHEPKISKPQTRKK
jgi:polyhydroxyalkanoate synthase subunit PhaE